MSNHGKASHLCITLHLFASASAKPPSHFFHNICAQLRGLRTAAAVACAEGVGAEDAAGARLESRSEGLVGLKAHVVVANWALDVAGCFARATGTSGYARQPWV